MADTLAAWKNNLEQRLKEWPKKREPPPGRINEVLECLAKPDNGQHPLDGTGVPKIPGLLWATIELVAGDDDITEDDKFHRSFPIAVCADQSRVNARHQIFEDWDVTTEEWMTPTLIHHNILRLNKEISLYARASACTGEDLRRLKAIGVSCVLYKSTGGAGFYCPDQSLRDLDDPHYDLDNNSSRKKRRSLKEFRDWQYDKQDPSEPTLPAEAYITLYRARRDGDGTHAGQVHCFAAFEAARRVTKKAIRTLAAFAEVFTDANVRKDIAAAAPTRHLYAFWHRTRNWFTNQAEVGHGAEITAAQISTMRQVLAQFVGPLPDDWNFDNRVRIHDALKTITGVYAMVLHENGATNHINTYGAYLLVLLGAASKLKDERIDLNALADAKDIKWVDFLGNGAKPCLATRKDAEDLFNLGRLLVLPRSGGSTLQLKTPCCGKTSICARFNLGTDAPKLLTAISQSDVTESAGVDKVSHIARRLETSAQINGGCVRLAHTGNGEVMLCLSDHSCARSSQ